MFEEFKYNLKHSRKSVIKQMTAWFLFGAIIVVFALFGLTPKNQQGLQGGTVAVVNDEQVSMAEMAETTDRLRRDPRFQQFASLGGDFGTKFLEQQALSQLIEMKLISQQTEKERIWTADAEVRDYIVAIPAFQEEGRFKHELYNNYLAMIRKSPSEFEQQIRTEKAVGRTVELFRTVLQPLPSELAKEKTLRDLKANLEYLSLPTQNLVSKDKVPQSEVEKFLADKSNEQSIKNYYDSHKETFSAQESVRARHILISTEGKDAAGEAKALETAKSVAARAKKEDFAKLAKEFSDDPGSKVKGGDLGTFTRGQMVKEFDEVAFTAPVGQVNDPIKTQFGYHIIQVQERKPASSRSLEEARTDIARMILAEKLSRTAVEEAENAVKSGDLNAVNAFASKYGLKWQETGTFAVDVEQIPQIGVGGDAVKTAFQLSPSQPLAKSLIRQGSSAFVVRYKAPSAEAKKLETPEQSPEIQAAMTANRRSEDALRQWIEGIRKNSKISTNEKYAATGNSEPLED
jgi:peptidyl-prolyl cis-trans isomerase D